MKTIGIFCGGFSSEWEISMKSAQTIQDNFPKEFATIKILVSKDAWNVNIENQSYPFDINTMSYYSDGVNKTIDAAIVYIHGDPGENGKIQGLLELKNIPFINSGILASALSFDKWYCNQFLKNFGIHVAESLFLSAIDQYNPEFIIETLGLPLFIKPSDSGSSYGISKVKKASELSDALKNAFKEGKTVVAESFLNGTEVTCGVYRSKKGIHALPLTEIVSENDFFDFEAKYKGKSDEITPARVSEEIKENVQNTAKKIYSLLQLRSIARIDFMVVNGEACVIEVNTTPGFSPASIVPQMLASAGISIETFWKEIVEVELVDRQRI
jgi:D-alanine-D-alanine ligase